jgi:spoIIIJ-associated protein
MEWVQTTGKTVEAAREAALDQLGVAAEDAEFEVIEEPRPGLFGRVRGEARVRARVRPTPVRPKQERRRRRPSADASSSNGDQTPAVDETDSAAASPAEPERDGDDDAAGEDETDSAAAAETAGAGDDASGRPPRRRRRSQASTSTTTQEQTMQSPNDDQQSTVTPEEVGTAAVGFMEGLATAFGATADVELSVDGVELDVSVSGSDLGLLVGPGGRTLTAVQDLARVAAQRRLGDHETRLRIDVGGYRARREVALGEFARSVAEQVRATGTARSLEPMTSADRKIVHDVLNDEDGVASRSVGEDPDRRIVVEPA